MSGVNGCALPSNRMTDKSETSPPKPLFGIPDVRVDSDQVRSVLYGDIQEHSLGFTGLDFAIAGVVRTTLSAD